MILAADRPLALRRGAQSGDLWVTRASMNVLFSSLSFCSLALDQLFRLSENFIGYIRKSKRAGSMHQNHTKGIKVRIPRHKRIGVQSVDII
jgi:hypothetical protein